VAELAGAAIVRRTRETTRGEDTPVNEDASSADRAKRSAVASRRDRGATFVELLVSIVLLGTVVVGVLTAVRASVIGSKLERDHAKAHQWLQSASENVRATQRWGCDTYTEAQIRTHYQDIIRAAADNPSGWPDDRIVVVGPIKFWDGEDYYPPPSCFDNAGTYLQLIEVQVTNADGDIIESVQVVKRD
jgi:Tfp pilus assembly protein PilX